ncbi:MAG: pantoate--beta-alanine ligase [Flavobacteriales bacterium]
MRSFERICDLRTFLGRQRRAGLQIGLVPTLGALHEGHAALVEAARRQNEMVVVSIFVNPTQFDSSTDFKTYPRDFQSDLAFCERHGVGVVFHPSEAEMYPEPPGTRISVPDLTRHLCGAKRPGHFEGVGILVSKLFNIAQPDRAYFGEKDAQQLAIIKRIVRDLDFPITLVGVPTVREADGLAMSSRNALLNPEQRRAAAMLNQHLQSAKQLLKSGEKDLKKVKIHLIERIQSESAAKIDYVEIVDAETLQPAKSADRSLLIAAAVYFGGVRLIDNSICNFVKKDEP